MEARLIYITAKDKDEARTIGKALLDKRLAACVNIIDGMESMYWWEGEIQHDQEVVLIVKSRSDLVEQITALVDEVHSYECPCVVSLPILDGNRAFLRWISTETDPQGS